LKPAPSLIFAASWHSSMTPPTAAARLAPCCASASGSTSMRSLIRLSSILRPRVPVEGHGLGVGAEHVLHHRVHVLACLLGCPPVGVQADRPERLGPQLAYLRCEADVLEAPGNVDGQLDLAPFGLDRGPPLAHRLLQFLRFFAHCPCAP